MATVVMTATRFEMRSSKDAMLPKPAIETVSDPQLTGVDPVPDDTEPFMLRQHTNEEVGDYDDGFKAGFKGRPSDDAKSQAWQRGWAEAQE
jgi:hypothetical protein